MIPRGLYQEMVSGSLVAIPGVWTFVGKMVFESVMRRTSREEKRAKGSITRDTVGIIWKIRDRIFPLLFF